MHVNEITHAVIGAAMEVHRSLGRDCSSRRMRYVCVGSWICGVLRLSGSGLCPSLRVGLKPPRYRRFKEAQAPYLPSLLQQAFT